jgi:hypothetical protein
MNCAIRNSRSGADEKANAVLSRAGKRCLERLARRGAEGRRPGLGAQRLPRAWPTGLLVAVLALSWCAQAAPDKIAKVEPAPKASAAPVETPIPQSVFVIPASAREGSNPFFPHSSAAAAAPQKPSGPVMDTSALVLNGITSKPFPSVMINGQTFEKGEEHELKLANGGKMKVRCEAIRQNSALILVNGVLQRELRLRAGL